MFSVAVLICVVGAVSALPQFNPALNPGFQPQPTPVFRQQAVAIPYLITRTYQHDDAGQYSDEYSLSDGTKVQERGTLVLNNAGDGYVLEKEGFFELFTPDNKKQSTHWTAGRAGFNVVP